MTEVIINETGCIVTRSGITGDILCRWPGAECDCLMQRIDASYENARPSPLRTPASHAERHRPVATDAELEELRRGAQGI